MAQTSAPPSAAPDDEVVALSPFVVAAERDSGWVATNTLSATRTRQSLLEVPVAIDAITREFMDDMNLNTADEVAAFISNVVVTPRESNHNDENQFNFRGLNQRGAISRNYFRWYVPTDNYNVERIDFGKGSNSLIYGDVEPGGQGAVFTKRALPENFGSVMAQIGSNDAHRYQLDVNRKLGDKLALRLNYVDRTDTTYIDWNEYDFEGLHLAVSFTPWKNTTIRAEYERAEYSNRRGTGDHNIREMSARSLGFPASNGWWLTSDGDIFATSSLAPANRSSANVATGATPSLIEGDVFSVKMRNAAGQVVGTRDIAGFRKGVNIRGTFDRIRRPLDTFSIYFEQRIGKLDLELAYNKQRQEADRNDNTFSTVIALDVNGRPYIDVANGLDRKQFGNEVDTVRFTAAYPLQPFRWMRQVLIASAEYREDFFYAYREELRNFAVVSPTKPVPAATDRIFLRAYLDDPRFPSKSFFDQFLPENMPRTSAFQPGWFAGNLTANTTEWRKAAAASLAASGDYFDGRFQTLLGARWDWNKTFVYQNTRVDELGRGSHAPHPRDAQPGEYLEDLDQNLSNTSITAGLTYRLVPGLHVYGVYSESFKWQGNRTFDLVRVGAITGTTKEIGLKAALFENKVTFNLAAFDIERANVAYRWSPDLLNTAELEELFNPNGLAESDPSYLHLNDDLNMRRDVLSSEFSKGFDGTLLLRVIPGLQVRLSVGYNDVITTPDFSRFRSLLEEAKARGNEPPDLIADAEAILRANDFDGKPSSFRSAPWTGSWAFDYAFPRDAWMPLKGVRLGVNGAYVDDYFFGVDDAGKEYYGGATHTVGAYVMRNQKIFGQDVRVRLGVRNLHDFENGNTREDGFRVLSDGSVVPDLRYIFDPRWDVTVTVRF